MRVLAATPYYAPEGGGLERYAHEILARLDDRGHEVHALAFTKDEAGTRRRDGVTVERVTPTLRLGNTPVDPAFPVRVDRRIRRSDPDVVLAHTPVPFPAEAAYLASRRNDVPFVVTYHAGRLRGGTPLLDLLATLHRGTLQSRMLAGAEARIATSPHVRDAALADHRERVTVVPPGVDHERFTPGGSREDARVLFVGPLDASYEWKGLDVLLAALPRVRRRRPGVELVLVGDGDRRAELEAYAEAVETPIEVRGRIPDGELVDAYRRATVTVLPSTSDAESFGMVLAEANACGCPVVASDVGGIGSLVRDGENGLLARPGDPGDLAARILELLEHPDEARRMGRRGRDLVRRDHDWDELAERAERVLDRASGAGARSPRHDARPPTHLPTREAST